MCLCHRGFQASVDQTLCMGESPFRSLLSAEALPGVYTSPGARVAPLTIPIHRKTGFESWH